MDDEKIYVIFVESEMGHGLKTGHWKIKYQGTTIGELPGRDAAINRALAQAPTMGVDYVVVQDGTNPDETIEV